MLWIPFNKVKSFLTVYKTSTKPLYILAKIFQVGHNLVISSYAI